MIRNIAPVMALLLGVAILLTGQGLQSILLPVRADLEGYATIAVAFIGATYFLGFTLGCWKGPALIRNAGHVRVFAAMTAIASASPLLHGLWLNIWSWGLLRFVSGFCFAVLYIVIESWLNERSTNESRGSIFSAYILINMTVLAVGQQMLLLEDPRNLTLFAVASVLVSLAAVPVVLSRSEAPREVEESRLDFRRLYATSPTGMLGSLASGLANGAYWSLAPVFAAAFSDTTMMMTAGFMTAGVMGGAVGQFPLGALSDRVDRRYVLIAISLVGVALSAGLWWRIDGLQPASLLAFGFGWGAIAFPVYSISVAHANDRADPGQYVMVSSGLLLMYGLGAITGPFLASAFMTGTGAVGLFVFTGLVHAVLALYALSAILRRNASAAPDHTEFNDALTSVITASHVFEEEQMDQDGGLHQSRR